MEKQYGYFDDAHREYVITAPQTPFPWINYLGTEDFFGLISNTGGGYDFYKDAKFRRITRYRYNGVPMDNGGRYFYISLTPDPCISDVSKSPEGEGSPIVWSPGWKPCKTPLDSYECRHGMNYTRITGSKNGVEAPQCVMAGKPNNSVAHGWSPIASHYVEVTLAPGESKDFIFLLGYVENEQDKKWQTKGVINKEKAHAMIERFSTADAVDKAFTELNAYWNKILAKFTISGIKFDNSEESDKLSRMVNIWNQYQCMITFCFSRSASFFESGVGRGMGFRDSNQDLVGFVHQVPSRARQKIIQKGLRQNLS